MSQPRTPVASHPVHAAGGLSRLGPWIRRYLPQHLAAAVSTVLACALLVRATEDEATIGVGTALVESAAFYGVALWRARTVRSSVRARSLDLLREYGVPEARDLVLRPALITAGVGLFPSAIAGAVIGSWLADLAFYRAAAKRVSPGDSPPFARRCERPG